MNDDDDDLHSVSPRTPQMRSDMDHTVLPSNNTISAFTRKHSSGDATMHIRSERLSLTYYLFIIGLRPQRLSVSENCGVIALSYNVKISAVSYFRLLDTC